MELELIRKYYRDGTNGEIYLNKTRICSSIELPWRNNQQRLSCIPEGKYAFQIRFSHRFQWHLLLKDVKDRALILIHPANDAKRELKGCIAPVTILASPGKGYKSRMAFERLFDIVFPALDKNEPVFLLIKSNVS